MNRLLITLLLLMIVLDVRADIYTRLETAWQYIDNKECDRARKLFDPPVSTPEEQCIFGKSICCSLRQNIKPADIDLALGNLDASLAAFGQSDHRMAKWIEDAKSQCVELRQSLADPQRLTLETMINERKNKAEVWSKYSGKVMSGCQQRNISPVLVGEKHAGEPPDWHYVSPRFGKDAKGLTPTESHLEKVLSDYVDSNPEHEVCAPFIAVSSTQDPKTICSKAHEFLEYFASTYEAATPPVWIAIYHYPPGGRQIRQHAERTTGKMRCRDVLGFFDWRRQSIVFRAPSNFFGTFRHELTHALMFWDMPLAPRWLEEGIAAMYEHTDANFQSLENPWRSRVLQEHHLTKISLAAFSKQVLSESLLEFEASPLGATFSREVMRKLQQCGDLPGLYRALKARSLQSAGLEAFREQPHRRPSSDAIAEWEELIERFAATESGMSCL